MTDAPKRIMTYTLTNDASDLDPVSRDQIIRDIWAAWDNALPWDFEKDGPVLKALVPMSQVPFPVLSSAGSFPEDPGIVEFHFQQGSVGFFPADRIVGYYKGVSQVIRTRHHYPHGNRWIDETPPFLSSHLLDAD